MNQQDIQVRKAVVADGYSILALLQQIATLHHQLYPNHFPSDNTKYTLADLETIITDPNWLVLVAVQGEVVVGHLFAQLMEHEWFIDDLCVDQKHRAQNIGKQFIESVTQLANGKEIQLNVWLKNEGARAFYEKLGFTPLKLVLTNQPEERQ